jgi:hypothetical protein
VEECGPHEHEGVEEVSDGPVVVGHEQVEEVGGGGEGVVESEAVMQPWAERPEMERE